MTNNEIVDRELGELKDGARCEWQFTPSELPADAPTMALEMWRTTDGKLHLFQMFIGNRKSDTWFREVRGFVHLIQAPID